MSEHESIVFGDGFRRDGSHAQVEMLIDRRTTAFVDACVKMRLHTHTTPREMAIVIAMRAWVRPAFSDALASWYECDDWTLWSLMPALRASESAIKLCGRSGSDGFAWAGGRYVAKDSVIHEHVEKLPVAELIALALTPVAQEHPAVRFMRWDAFVSGLDVLQVPDRPSGWLRSQSVRFDAVVVECAELVARGASPAEIRSLIPSRLDPTEPRTSRWLKTLWERSGWTTDPGSDSEHRPAPETAPETTPDALASDPAFDPWAALEAEATVKAIDGGL